MSRPVKRYRGEDIAIIVPTKDRPKKMQEFLSSMVMQGISLGRMIIIDGGESIESIVKSFADRLPVEYYTCQPPGQIRQRNLGISKLDTRTSLVACFDDDIILEPGSLNAMINFWNRCEPFTAGVSFNIVNAPAEVYSRVRAMLGLTASEPGRVLKSGMTTSNCNVSRDIRSQWLCGGATIWRREILEAHLHNEVASRWAIAEDLIFSYPIGKKYPLYISSESCVRHEHVQDYVKSDIERFHGRTQTLWLMYFVKANHDLSMGRFIWAMAIKITGKILLGIISRKPEYLNFARGQLEGLIHGLKAVRKGRAITDVVSDFT